MRIPLLSFVLSVLVFSSFSSASSGEEAKDCRSYVKSPDWIICLHSGNGEDILPQTVPDEDAGTALDDPKEGILNDPEGPPESAFFVEDEYGEITDQPRVFNDFSNDGN